MKKLLTALLAFLLLFSVAAAEGIPFPYEIFPFASFSPETESAGSLDMTIQGRSLTLAFDSDPAYSMIEDGLVQASFFSYTEDETLYEVYLIFPETVSSGDTVSTQTQIAAGDELSGVLMYITGPGATTYAEASQYQGEAYPAGTQYACYFEEVVRTDGLYTFSGTFEADLVMVNEYDVPTGTIDDVVGNFSFSIDPTAVAPVIPMPELPDVTVPPSDNYAAPFVPGSTIPPQAKKI